MAWGRGGACSSIRRGSRQGREGPDDPGPGHPPGGRRRRRPTPASEPVDAEPTDPRRVVGFRPAYVWDISQTTGEPLPTPPTPALLAGQAPAGLWDALADQCT